MISTTIEWFDPRKKLPEEDGYYLVYTRYYSPFSVFQFATKLSDFNYTDFPEEFYSHGGFVNFDGSKCEWFEVPIQDIKYWAKIPEIKEEKNNG